ARTSTRSAAPRYHGRRLASCCAFLTCVIYSSPLSVLNPASSTGRRGRERRSSMQLLSDMSCPSLRRPRLQRLPLGARCRGEPHGIDAVEGASRRHENSGSHNPFAPPFPSRLVTVAAPPRR